MKSEDLRVEIIKRYDNGQKKLLVKYKGEGVDEVIVERITYSESGDTLILEKPLEKVKMVREYYENGRQIEGNYKDDKKDGKWTSYHKNGEIEIELNYKDGKLDGKRTSYYPYPNGQIFEEENYKDGEKDGKRTSYYKNGQIEWEENYIDGKLNGKQTYYNEYGSINKVEEYKDGKLVK